MTPISIDLMEVGATNKRESDINLFLSANTVKEKTFDGNLIVPKGANPTSLTILRRHQHQAGEKIEREEQRQSSRGHWILPSRIRRFGTIDLIRIHGGKDCWN
jgi:hypothetical protein